MRGGGSDAVFELRDFSCVEDVKGSRCIYTVRLLIPFTGTLYKKGYMNVRRLGVAASPGVAE